MADIEFDAAYGDEIKKVTLSQPNGARGGSWHISIGNYHHGVIFEKNGGYSYEDDKLSPEDVQALVDRIAAYKGEPTSLVVYYPPSHWESRR